MGQGDARRAVLKDRIRQDVADGMEKTQREFLLRQQLAAIRKELGEDGDADDADRGYRRQAEARGVPERVREAIAAGDRQAGADPRAEPRARVDPHLARHHLRAAVGRPRPTTSTSAPRRPILDADHTASTT